ncbi:hypothetical protein Moror_4144 [Moniliophthora roreri MCA 2997]|uniref:Uncharacterized protein n=1 Tax=Moniliophthora roreri (strain MCA 2997) TaxID=1381753 RepID=V2XDX5_MONRO|nr:hypothetical protein Moror_4144 [Moniliophthora roreri MCA 2997]
MQTSSDDDERYAPILVERPSGPIVPHASGSDRTPEAKCWLTLGRMWVPHGATRPKGTWITYGATVFRRKHDESVYWSRYDTAPVSDALCSRPCGMLYHVMAACSGEANNGPVTFYHYVLPNVSPEYVQWTPLHFKILCYSINCIKQHRYLRTKSEWEQMLSAFMDEVLRYLHTQVGKEYEARRFSFPPLWDERLAIPVVSLMAIFVEVDDLNRPVLQYGPARRSDYEAVSTPRVVSDLPTIRQVVPRQLPFTPITVIQLNWDVYLTNYDLNQQSPLLGLQGLPLPFGLDAAQGEPQLASDCSGTGRSRPVATSNSALSTATGLSAIASSSRNTVLGLTAVKCAREDPASPVSGGFFYGAIAIALLPRQGTRGRMTPARRECIDYSDGMEGRCD